MHENISYKEKIFPVYQMQIKKSIRIVSCLSLEKDKPVSIYLESMRDSNQFQFTTMLRNHLLIPVRQIILNSSFICSSIWLNGEDNVPKIFQNPIVKNADDSYFYEKQMPVSLTDFTAALQNNHTLLQWQTASEYKLSHFTIERSVNGNNFSTLSNVAAFGNSNTKINYSTIDYAPLPGTNYYRIKLVDADGQFTYSKIAAVNNNG